MIARTLTFFIFFFNDTATTEIYTLSLHDALPIFHVVAEDAVPRRLRVLRERRNRLGASTRRWFEYETAHSAPSSDRKSTRLNSSHANISYAVFCLKKKKQL